MCPLCVSEPLITLRCVHNFGELCAPPRNFAEVELAGVGEGVVTLIFEMENIVIKISFIRNDDSYKNVSKIC